MLKIIIPGDESFDEASNEFIRFNDVTLELEHSLVSLSKWESKFEKPFLGAGEKTEEEILAYIEAMIVTPDFPPEVFSRLTQDNLDKINDYINAKMTATWFNDRNTRSNREVITSELIYYWMVAYNIPFEVERWHLNRLFALIKTCAAKNEKPKRQNKAEMIAERQRLNAERRKQYNTSG